MPDKVYDPETEGKDVAGRTTSGNNASFTRGDSLDPVRRAEGGLWRPHGDSTGTPEGGTGSSTSSPSGGAVSNTGGLKGGLSPSSLQDGEESAGLAKGFNVDNTSSTSKKQARFLISRRQAIIGGGVLTSVAGLGIATFFLLIPLKIEHIVSNLESRFFATSENAVSNETDNMFKDWIKNQIGPAMKLGNCSKEGNIVVSKNCTMNFAGNGNNPVQNLYKTWSQAKLENTLSDKWGIELRYDKSKNGGTYYLKAPGINGETTVGNASGIGSDFDKVDRGTVRQTFLSSEKDMTSWDKVMFRYKVGRLLEEKYAIKRCIVYCGTRDALADSASNKKYTAKYFLVERVITPHQAALGAVVGCLLNTNGCEQSSPTTCAQPPCDALAGQPQTQADADVAKAVGDASSGFGSETADKLIGSIKGIRDAGGPQNYVLNKLISQVFNQDVANNAVPVIGELQTISTVTSFINKAANAPATLKKYSYIAGAGSAVSLYMMYRTYADELHTGHIDATELGSFTNSLSTGDQCVASIEGTCSSTPTNGTSGAEGTPLYNNLMEDNTSSAATTASLLGDVLPAKAYAAGTSTSTTSSTYRCNNNKSVPAGQLVCPEEVLGQSNGVVSKVSSALNSSGLGGLASGFQAIINNPLLKIPVNALESILGSLTSWFSSAAESAFEVIPGVTRIINQAKSLVSQFVTFLTGQLIPSPFSQDESGGRTFDMMAAGADVAGNDYAHTGLGGKAVSATTAAQIASAQEVQAKQQFSHQSFFARMFSTNSQYSLVSKVAMDIPFNVQSSSGSSFASLISNPFGALAHGFASIFSGNASAGTSSLTGVVNGQDFAGVTQYAPDVVDHPSDYWDQNCTNNAAQAYQKNNSWDQAAANYNTNQASDLNGMPVNTTSNPCLTIMGSTGSAGGALDTSNLTSDDLADTNPGSSSSASSTASTAGGFANPFPGGWTPNRLDMGYDGHFTKEIVSPCAGNVTGTYTSSGPNSWEGYYMAVQCSTSISGLPTKTFYFAEGITPTVKSGPVTAGQQIAVPGPTGFTEGPGGIEWGLATDSTPTQAYAAQLGGVNTCTPTTQSKAMVLSFYQWVTQNLHVPGPTTDEHCAGAP